MNGFIRLSQFFLALALVAQIGCRAMDEFPWTPASELEIEGDPQKIVALWSPASISEGKPKATRGIGGRLYFYDELHRTMKVDGKLIVYAYDEESGTEHSKPDRKFEFSSEELEESFSKTQFGPSYSIWLPWDEVGGYKTSISLFSVFTNADGKVLTGQNARTVLPGKSNSGEHEILDPNEDWNVGMSRADELKTIRKVVYDEPADDAESINRKRRRRARREPISISLPASMRNRVLRSKQTTTSRQPSSDHSDPAAAFDVNEEQPTAERKVQWEQVD